MTAIRVLIADDEPTIRSSLRMLVDSEADMTVIAEVGDGERAIRAAEELRPNVVLMDVQMPRMSGLEAARELGEQGSDARIIVLTMFDLDEYVYEALRAGASGFLLKNCPPSEILRAIRVAHEGNALLAPEVTRRLIERFAPARAESRLDQLTTRERETLALIAQGQSNAEIAAELFVTATTVRTYVSRILGKLQIRDRAGLVVVAYESGIVRAELSTPAD